MSVREDRYLLAGATVMIVGPVFLGAYVYYFLSTTYAQQRAVQASQNWSHVIDASVRKEL